MEPRRKSCKASSKQHESPRKAPGARGSGQAAPRRHDRRRQIRRHVHCASAEDAGSRSEEHTSELQSQSNLVCRLLLEKKKKKKIKIKKQHIPENYSTDLQ